MRVFKFGGTSVGSAERMLEVAALVKREAADSPLVVVASAMTGVTNLLVEAAHAVADGDRDRASDIVAELDGRHNEALATLLKAGAEQPGFEGGDTLIDLRDLMSDLWEMLAATVHIGELTPRVRDRILSAGEKMSVRLLVVAMRAVGLEAVAMDADTFLETDGSFGEASPLSGIADRTVQAALTPHLSAGRIAVVTGFCGRAPDGATTTLGRGGSDLTATVIAGALDADEVTLWSDVDGVYSADPRVVPEARVIPQLNFREAAEMSYYGAKVLHQRTMIPVAGKGIPVRSRNTSRPKMPGTLIDGRFTPGSHPVKAITAVRDHALLSVEGKGMAGVPGVAARVFGALAARDISVTMISQSSSEASICFAVPADHALGAEAALKRTFRADISRGAVEEIVVRRGVGLVAAVGLGMARTPGVAARLFTALARHGVNIYAIAQGSSELNVSLAIADDDVPDALRAMHSEFGLDRLDTGVDPERHFDILLVGAGKVGRALLNLLPARRAHIRARFGLDARVVGVADRSGFVFEPAGISDERLAALVETKAGGQPLTAAGATPAASPGELIEHALTYRLARPVVVDVTDASENGVLFRRAFALGADVVTANKGPLASDYTGLQEAAAEAHRVLKAEATVGAGLPVVDTLEVLLATGDELKQAEGCLSGTLGFLMTRLEEGAAFSDAVHEAVELGYTEPDPAIDLSGEDVARKATILGRMAGLTDASTPVELEGLVSADWVGMSYDELRPRLASLDASIAARIQAASDAGNKMRFVARVRAGSIQVGLTEVPGDSALGMLRGTDNMVVFRSERYDQRPLVVSGPGAGIDVTAMGVLGDILRIAAERTHGRIR
jgi:bifunctional aspartokinase / homoserine dehydrogenase 1